MGRYIQNMVNIAVRALEKNFVLEFGFIVIARCYYFYLVGIRDYLHFVYSLIRMYLYRLFYVWYLFLMLRNYFFLFCNFTNCMQLSILNSEMKILLINKYTVISFKQCIIFFAELS